jgi:hypothetical protein
MKIERGDIYRLIKTLGQLATDDIEWSENILPPDGGFDFASEAIFVIANSGMHHTAGRAIYTRVMAALKAGGSAGDVFGHVGKAGAMDTIWRDRDALWAAYMEADDKLAACRALPWVGGITCYHLAKNFGADVAKPDRHLQRLANAAGESVQGLCDRLAAATGYRAATIDLILWRACATGLIDSNAV